MLHQWQAVKQAIRQAIEQAAISPGQIAAIGVCGHGNGLYLLNRQGEPLGNAYSSMDYRALDLVKSVESVYGPSLRELTLQNLWSGQPGFLLRWLKQNQPAIYSQIGAVLFCKDWIRYCLTGVIHTDFTDISASGLFDNRQRAYHPAILAQLGISEIRKSLPELIGSGQVAGIVQSKAAEQTGLLAGTPVMGGMFDVTANSLGAGLNAAGRYCVIAGTWNINVALSPQPRFPRLIRQVTLYGDERFYCNIDSSATSASNLAWFLQNVLGGSCSYEEFEGVIARYRPADLDILFMPFAYGGLKNDNPGVWFCGMKSVHNRDDLLRAIAEGVGFAHNYHLQTMRQEGLTGESILFTGGVSRNKAWSQLLADILQLPLEVPETSETGALGVCIMAAVGAGIFPSLDEAIGQMTHIRAVYEPHGEHAIIFQQKYQRFLEILNQL